MHTSALISMLLLAGFTEAAHQDSPYVSFTPDAYRTFVRDDDGLQLVVALGTDGTVEFWKLGLEADDAFYAAGGQVDDLADTLRTL